jgi:hypothetical protein
LRRNLQKAHSSHEGTLTEIERPRQPDSIER